MKDSPLEQEHRPQRGVAIVPRWPVVSVPKQGPGSGNDNAKVHSRIESVSTEYSWLEVVMPVACPGLRRNRYVGRKTNDRSLEGESNAIENTYAS
jgi:hypothetical protein